MCCLLLAIVGSVLPNAMPTLELGTFELAVRIGQEEATETQQSGIQAFGEGPCRQESGMAFLFPWPFSRSAARQGDFPKVHAHPHSLQRAHCNKETSCTARTSHESQLTPALILHLSGIVFRWSTPVPKTNALCEMASGVLPPAFERTANHSKRKKQVSFDAVNALLCD